MIKDSYTSLDIIRDLRTIVRPLKSIDVGKSFEDLKWLKPILSSVKIVGLGEATHGTREFFQMKHRLLEFLVIEMGFTTFAIEASYAGCANIDNYVRWGKGNARSALASQGFWTWDTEEVVELIEWIRQHNKDVPDDKKVRFVGFDFQSNAKSGGIDLVERYFDKVAPILAAKLAPIFAAVRKFDIDRSGLDGIRDEVLGLMDLFVTNKDLYVGRTSVGEYEQAQEYLTSIIQYVDVFSMAQDDPRKAEREWRDYYMSTNLRNAMSHQNQEKAVVWGHNAHIAKEVGVNSGQPMGSYLKEFYGEAYYALGFVFGKGSFQAIEFKDGKPGSLKDFCVTAPKTGTLDHRLSEVGAEIFIINFRNDAMPRSIRQWLSEPLMSRNFGAFAHNEWLEDSYYPVTVTLAYDGLIYFDNTTRAIPTSTGIR